MRAGVNPSPELRLENAVERCGRPDAPRPGCPEKGHGGGVRVGNTTSNRTLHAGRAGAYNSSVLHRLLRKPQIRSGSRRTVTDTNSFTGIERRRTSTVPSERREAGEVAVFHELGKALTSSLQLDQVLRTIMEKIEEFLHPDTWSLLLVDAAKQELYFELAIGKNAHTLKDVRIKMGQGIAGWVARVPGSRDRSRRQPRHAILRQGGRKNEDGDALDRGGSRAFPRSLPGRDRAGELRGRGWLSRPRPGAARSAGGFCGHRSGERAARPAHSRTDHHRRLHDPCTTRAT